MANAFIPARSVLWTRLAELAQIQMKTEAQRFEEQSLSRQFWDWSAVENRLKYPIAGYADPSSQTPIQNRIMLSVRHNCAVS